MGSKAFRNGREAGRVLAEQLEHYRDDRSVVVVALPRGGVPVAFEVASALRAPLEVYIVRKLGVPGQPEYAMGAIASGGAMCTNDDVIRAVGVTSADVERVAEQEGRELARREATYRGNRPPLDLADKTVIIVDDGLATGATMKVAVQGIRTLAPDWIVVAVPAAPEDTCQELWLTADEVVCATTPTPFVAVGAAYWEFDQTTDAEVRALLTARTTGRPAQRGRPTDRLAAIRRDAVPAPSGRVPDRDLFELVGDARIVLIGEASHGTHEFYAARAELTRRLIEANGFLAIAVEADWPDAYRVNRFVHDGGADRTADQALSGFQRFPQWMWRNTVVVEFIEWLRAYNAETATPTGLYGMDLYSMYRSAGEVIGYLDGVDPAAAKRARRRYGCFEHAATDERRYGYVAFGAGMSCEDAVVAQLRELQTLELERVRRDGMQPADERFYAEQNALLVKDAEEYYRSMFSGHVHSWNLRDRHMMRSLAALIEHLERDGAGPARIVVWAHNSHLGDARATELGDSGELNLGQLVRERFGDQSRSIGFTTYTGRVTAADDWGDKAVEKLVPPGLPGSVEALFHDADEGDFFLRGAAMPNEALLQRAIGVVYRPQTERRSHYFVARLAEQFDAIVHIEKTTAVTPLERLPAPAAEPAETYPSGV
jgi:erythromycin esterase-like protein/predicted phosphoribosyltransferase